MKYMLIGVWTFCPSAILAQTVSDAGVTDPATFAALRNDVSLAPGGFSVNCTIKPLQAVEVSVPLPGIVSEVFVRPEGRSWRATVDPR